MPAKNNIRHYGPFCSAAIIKKLTSEENREDQDQPQARAGSSLDASNTEYGNFGAGIEPQAKHDAERVHLPRPVYNPKQLPKDICQEAHALERQLPGGGILVSGRAGLLAVPDLPALAFQQRPEPLDQAEQDPGIPGTQDE